MGELSKWRKGLIDFALSTNPAACLAAGSGSG
jgi:hypothetical protein